MAKVATAYVEVRPDLGAFAAQLKTELAKIQPVKTVHVRASMKGFESAVDRGLDKIEDRVIKPKIKPELDRGAMGRLSKQFRTMGRQFGGGTIGRIFGTTFRFISTMMEQSMKLVGEAVTGVGSQLMKLGDKFGKVGEFVGDFGMQLVAAAPKIGGLVGGVVGLAVALAGVGAIMGAVEFGLGALLAIVIPLTAAVTALVAELFILGSAAAASLFIIPGALLGAAAAFGPLMLVMEKFQALFQKTADAVGPLYEVFERLKNAIFAVITDDFVKMFSTFANTVLPKLFIGIDRVSQAWSRLLTGLLEIASMPGVMAAFNQALTFGAKLVDMMGTAIALLGPTFLEFAAAALPALEVILNQVMGLIGFFDNWFNTMVKTGGAAALFSDVAAFIGQILTLVRQLAPLLGTFMTVALPPARQFVAVIGQIFTALNAMYTATGGQQALANFFNSMNSIVAQLGQLFVQIQPAIMEFGSIISEAMTAARPLASAFLDIMMNLLRNAMPGVNEFMREMSRILSEPATQMAVQELGTAIGNMMAVFADKEAVIAFLQVLTLLIDIAKGAISVINKLAGATSYLTAAYYAATGNMNGAAKIMATQLQSSLDKTKVNTINVGETWKTMSRTGVAAFDNIAGASTSLANAPSWQAIIDNSSAAAQAINSMGYAAYQANNEIDKQTYEKTVGRIFMAKKTAKKVAKPKVDTTGLSSAWTSGWVSAIDASTGKISTTAAKSAKKVKSVYLTNLKPTVKELNVMSFVKAPRSFNTGLEIARYLAKGITSGSKNIRKATDIIYRGNKTALKNLAKEVVSFAGKVKTFSAALPKTWATDVKKMTSVKQLDAYLEKQQQKWRDTLAVIQEFKGNVRDALTPDRNLTGVFGYFPTPAEVKAKFDAQLAQMRDFAAGIKLLQEKGLDPALAREWLTAGVAGAGNMVQGLKNATTAEIGAITASYKAVGTEAETIAEAQAVKWQGVGEQTVIGYIAGIESMQKQVTGAMSKMLTAALKEAKKDLKIKSPSQVYASLGVNTMAGYIEGITSMGRNTIGAVSDLFASVTKASPPVLRPKVKPSLAHTGTLGQIAANGPMINVHVYIGDKELKDITRIAVENADSTRARALLAGRRGG